MGRRACGAAFFTAALRDSLVGPADAGGSSRRRTQESPYSFDFTDPGVSAWFGADYGIFFGEAVTLQSLRRDKTVDVSVVDDSGGAVTAAVWQEGGDTTVFCESTAQSIPISGGDPVYVQVFIDVIPAAAGASGCATPAMPSTGKVTATFRR